MSSENQQNAEKATTSLDLEKQADNSSHDEAPEAPQETEKPGARAGLTVKQFWVVLFGLNIGMLLTALDFNIVATAVPIISSEFNEYKNSSWLGTGFLITFALVLPIYAKLGDIFGRKNMFLLGTAIFFLGSALCGWSQSMNMLIWSRVIQGIGGGGIYGLVNVIITDLVPLREVGKYLSATAAIWAVADVAGPLLGGVFSQYVTWRWCFWLNLIISPISFALTFVVLKLPSPQVSILQKIKTFDYSGAVFIIGGTTCLLLGLSWGGNQFPWGDAKVIGTLCGGIGLWIVFMVNECFVKDPLIFPSMFKTRTLITIYFAEFFYGANLLGMMYYTPQFFQLVFRDSATLSGVGLIPMMVGLGIGNPLAGFVTSKYGVSLYNAIAGAGLMTLASGLMTRWNDHTSRAEAVILLIILGFGQGAVMSGLLLSAQVAVEPINIGIVTGLVIFMQIIGDIFGIAIFASVYVNKLTDYLRDSGLSADLVAQILGDVQIIHKELDPSKAAEVVNTYARSLQNGWWLMFACAVATLIFSCCSRQKVFAA